MGLKLHHVKALPQYLIKIGYRNTFTDNSHLLILVGYSYGSETSPSESSPKSR